MEIENFYRKLVNLKVSQNCEDAAQDYFNAIELYAANDGVITSDIIRVAIRPVFYLGFTTSENMLLYINSVMKAQVVVRKFLNHNTVLIEKEVQILEKCCRYYGLHYIADHHGVFMDSEKTLVFHCFEDFKKYIADDFSQLNLSDAELAKLIEEEAYLNVFSQMPA